MREWYKNKKESAKKRKENTNTSEEKFQELESTEEIEEEQEFKSFFEEVLKKLPQKTAAIVLNAYDTSRDQAEKILAKSKGQFDQVFEQFLEGVDEETKKRTHRTIHAASLTAAIIGMVTVIPFSDAFLLVPVQITMMGRLHKLFDVKFSENLGQALSRELIIVSVGKNAAGNLMKFVPIVGTVTGAAVNAVVASTITQALGWITVKMLNEGEDIFDDVMSFKAQFNMLYKTLKESNKA